MKITTPIKTGLSETLKWLIRKGTTAGSICIRVPNTTNTKELVRELRSLRPPAVTYHAPTGHIQAWQWHLDGEEHRNLWTCKSPRLAEDEE